VTITHADEVRTLTAKRSQVHDELAAIAKRMEGTDAEFKIGEAKWQGMVERAERLEKQVKKLDAEIESHRDAIRDEIRNGGHQIESGSIDVDRGGAADPWDPRRNLEIRDRARRSLDALAKLDSPGLPGAIERVSIALDGREDDGADLDKLARWTAVASDPDYLSAFVRLAKDPQNGHREFTEPELRAFQRAQHEQRAMSLSDSAGGYLVPMQLDPSVIQTSDSSYNEVRVAARKVLATGDVWHGVSSAGVTASWDGEAVEVSDDSPTLAQPAITVHKLAGFVPISIEALADAQNVAQEVAELLSQARDDLESVALVTGTGTSQPWGVHTRIAAVTACRVTTTTADTFQLADVYKIDEALPAKWRKRSSWLAHRAIYNDTRAFDTAGGAALWTQLSNDVPPNLLGRPTLEAEAMPSGPSGTNVHFMILGDFSRGYVIADRIGTTIEFIPHLFGASGRPTGQRGWYMYARVGADVVANNAFKILNGQ
jgi:HK97 family phage major capsid protein